MALVVADRVQETTTTTGTGTITLAGAVSGFQSFATIGNANTTYYCVTSGANWEVGIGTYTASGTTLARTTILASSAAGAAITLAGTSNVFCVYPASKAVYEDASGNIAGYPFTAGTINSTTIGATTPSTGEFTTLATGGVAVAGYSFTSRSTGLTNAYFVDTDAGVNGMNINFLKNSASPAASDDIALLRFYGNDSTAVQTEYVRLAATIADPTNASEDGTFSLITVKAGALGERVRYTSADGLYVVDGAFRCPDAYASTTGTAANMVMSSASGILQRSTSSLRYKNSVADATYGLAEVMQLRPVTYKGNNDGDTVFGGFIAEEVHDIGLSQFVQYDDQNRPDALAYGNMVSLLTKAMQEQQAVIEDLKARVAALEAK